MNKLRRAVLTYYAYRCISAVGFIGPFLNLFLLNRGVSFTGLALGGSTMAAVTLLGEVPSGYAGDRLGRRRSLLLSQTLFAVAISGWAFVYSTVGVVAVFAVTGVASAFQSGSTEAWLYDTLDEAGQAGRFTEIASRGSSLRLWVTATTMVVGGLLFVLEPLLPFACAAALSWSGVGIVASLPANARYRGPGCRSDDPLGPRRALSLVQRFLNRPDLRVLLAVVTVFIGGSVAAGDYLQPVVVGVLSGTTASTWGIAVPEHIVLGCLYAGFTTLAAVAVDRADALRDALGPIVALLALVATGGAAMAMPLVGAILLGGPTLAVATLGAVVCFRVCSDVVHPIYNGYLNDRASSVGRATTLSAVSFLGSGARVVVLLVGGAIADTSGPTVALAAVGVGALLVAALGAITGPTATSSVVSDTDD